MAIIELMCMEAPQLKLGPGTPSQWPDEPATIGVGGVMIPGRRAALKDQFLRFDNGFCTFDDSKTVTVTEIDRDGKEHVTEVKLYADWKKWVATYPGITILSTDGKSLEGLPDDAANPNICPVCQRSFKNDFGLKGHLRSHAREGVPA